ncbi:MAG: ribonuclease H-like domain-containing protein [Lachnospiraceae bacterium]|nr:ribonuclease H-like domain-containing protein [Lachnospiraceae bacterium]
MITKQGIFPCTINVQDYLPLAPEQYLFWDIETTGFSHVHAQIYLIGCTHVDSNGKWHYAQWMTTKKQEESSMIQAFLTYAKNFHGLIHFNGNTFDLPFLKKRAERFQIISDFSEFFALPTVDLYQIAGSMKKLLQFENFKQPTIEKFLGIQREEFHPGDELIDCYRRYQQSQTALGKASKVPGLSASLEEAIKRDEAMLLTHNYDDITHLPLLLPILSYEGIKNHEGCIEKVARGRVESLSQGDCFEDVFLLTIRLPKPLLRPITYESEELFLEGTKDILTLQLPIHRGEFKEFHKNYKDYLYLPTEDLCFPKKSLPEGLTITTEPCKAATCYTRHYGEYLKLPRDYTTEEPTHRISYEDKALFLPVSSPLLHSFQFWEEYYKHCKY